MFVSHRSSRRELNVTTYWKSVLLMEEHKWYKIRWTPVSPTPTNEFKNNLVSNSPDYQSSTDLKVQRSSLKKTFTFLWQSVYLGLHYTHNDICVVVARELLCCNLTQCQLKDDGQLADIRGSYQVSGSQVQIWQIATEIVSLCSLSPLLK